MATGASWLCYFAAIAIGHVSVVAPVGKSSVGITIILSAILLKEKVERKTRLAAFSLQFGRSS